MSTTTNGENNCTKKRTNAPPTDEDDLVDLTIDYSTGRNRRLRNGKEIPYNNNNKQESKRRRVEVITLTEEEEEEESLVFIQDTIVIEDDKEEKEKTETTTNPLEPAEWLQQCSVAHDVHRRYHHPNAFYHMDLRAVQSIVSVGAQ
jgi:hypothetical protein